MDSSAKFSRVFSAIIFNPQGESFVIQNATQEKAEEFMASFKDVGNYLIYKTNNQPLGWWFRFSASLKWEFVESYRVPNLYKAEAAIVL